MKYAIICFLVGLMCFSCDSYKTATGSTNPELSAQDTVRIANDSLEYEIIIIEPGFNNWLVTQFPEDYYSLSFLETRNRFYVAAYNRRVLNATRYDSRLYEMQINYEPNVRYGKEVNYLLYNYFVYFEKTYRQNLQ